MARLIDQHGNPLAPQISSGIPPMNSGSGNPPSGSGGNVEHEIFDLQGRVGRIEKGLTAAGSLLLVAFGWLFYNVYQPIQDIKKDFAVQNTVLQQIQKQVESVDEQLRQGVSGNVQVPEQAASNEKRNEQSR